MIRSHSSLDCRNSSSGTVARVEAGVYWLDAGTGLLLGHADNRRR
ncbi:MAG: hypothetical protein U0930_25230 [Pirellulales bacterium]